jgi:putative oxidoreductase
MIANPFLRWMDRLYGFIVSIGSNLQSVILLYLRLTWGHQYFLTGSEKLKDIEGTIQFLTDLNFPAPAFHAYEIAIIQAVGGFLLFIGFASRLAAIPLVLVTSTLLITAHKEYLSDMKFVSDPHLLVIQEPFPFLLTALIILAFGPGRIALDALLKRWIDHQPRY